MAHRTSTLPLALSVVWACATPSPPPAETTPPGEAPPAAPASQPASAPASQPASQPSDPPGSRPAEVQVIDPTLTVSATLSMARLKADVAELASDAYEGRGPATKGLGKAAAYLERELKKLKVSPAFGKSFRQPFEMTVGVKLGKKNRLLVDGQAQKVGTDFMPYGFSKSGEVKGELVFAGYGISAKEYDYDDYAGLDVANKVVVVLGDEPGELDPKSPFDGRRPTRHSQLRTKSLLAREAKAAALLVVKDPLSGKLPSEPESEAGIVALRITPQVASALLGFDVLKKKEAIDATFKPSGQVTRRSTELAVEILRERRKVDNVGAFVGPADAKEVVVLGAHYDHLGYGGADSLSGTDQPLIHNGADDNASGTAAILEVARDLSAHPEGLRRRVLFLWFAGEESGLLGSNHFVKHAPFELKSVKAMLNLDMVGRMQGGKLHVMGTKTAPEWDALVQKVVHDRGLLGRFGGDGYGPSDHTSFYAEGVPVLFLFTGAHSDYHKPSDDADRINYRGLALAGAVAGDLVRIAATSAVTPSYVAAPPPAAPSGGHGYGAYFGSIPDFGEEVKGVLLAGVREGSPAEKAGVKKGDLITRFNGVAVLNLQDLTVALRACAPGDVVEVELLRAGAPLKVQATLQKRE